MAFNWEQVEYGSEGVHVMMCQLALRMLQFTGSDGKPLEVDGVAQDNTVHAINAFQSTQMAYGFDCGTDGQPDGKFGPKCWHLLGVW